MPKSGAVMTETPISSTVTERRALLLDFDGTIADTLPALRATYADFLHMIGAMEKAPTFDQANGANLAELITRLCREHVPDRNAAEIWQNYWHSVEAAVLETAPMAGTGELMMWAKQAGWCIGIASASRSPLISHWLAQHHLDSQIDCIVGGDLCDRSKPDPAIYRMLMNRLAVEPQHCIVVEDSEAGVESASRAGLDVIRLTATLSSASPAAVPCHEVADLPGALAYLQQRFASPRQH